MNPQELDLNIKSCGGKRRALRYAFLKQYTMRFAWGVMFHYLIRNLGWGDDLQLSSSTARVLACQRFIKMKLEARQHLVSSASTRRNKITIVRIRLRRGVQLTWLVRYKAIYDLEKPMLELLEIKKIFYGFVNGIMKIIH